VSELFIHMNDITQSHEQLDSFTCVTELFIHMNDIAQSHELLDSFMCVMDRLLKCSHYGHDKKKPLTWFTHMMMIVSYWWVCRCYGHEHKRPVLQYVAVCCNTLLIHTGNEIHPTIHMTHSYVWTGSWNAATMVTNQKKPTCIEGAK